MSRKSNHWLRAISLLVLIASFLPSSHAGALAVRAAPPPVDMFQLPWDQGIAWVAIDGLDNGTRRPLNSSHNYKVGGAIDFAPRARMVTGEDTSKFWVAAAAGGTVVERTSCSVRLAHGNGWITEYQFLGNIQVKLGDTVARNQRLGIIADGVRQRYCPGYTEINVPHLHFMLRPSMIGAAFAGWTVNYNSFFNTTSFTKNGTTFGLYKPLMNTMDSVPTPTTTPISTPTTQPSPTPTIMGPYVSTTVSPPTFNVGESALVTVSLNNVPTDGYTSAEFTCSYDPGLFEVSNITLASLFGADAAAAINGPQNGKFIVAIAGSNGNKATTSDQVFTFNIKGLQPTQMYFGCTARVSTGNNILTEIPAANAYITILGEGTATANLTPSVTSTVIQLPTQDTATPGGPTDTPSPTLTPGGGATATPVGGVAYGFAENACAATWFSGAGQLPCPGIDGDERGFVLLLAHPLLETGISDTRPGLLTNPQNVMNGYIQGIYPPFHVQNGDRFRAIINCEYGATNCYVGFRLDYQIGAGPIQTLWGPFLERYDGIGYPMDIDLNPIAGQDVKFILTVLASGPASGDRAEWVNPIIYRSASISTAVPTVTAGGNWLLYTNQKYGFQFGYPAESQIVPGATDNYIRFNLPYTQGTNIGEKYLEVTVQENANPCQSPLATSSMLETSETIVYGGISYLVQTGQDGSAGHTNKWTAYTTMRDNACVSLSFVIRAANPGMFATPPSVYDETFETAVYGQIVTTYMWLALLWTPTPTFTPALTESPTPTLSTPSLSPTPVPAGNGTLAGQVTASKLVMINVFDATNTLIASTAVSSDGTFSLSVPAGAYTVVADADGFLHAQGSVTITAGNPTTKPAVALVGGDLDGNNVIDQFDALTIGMSYNASTPGAADLNNDGIINVLDLERLAKNYRQTGPIVW